MSQSCITSVNPATKHDVSHVTIKDITRQLVLHVWQVKPKLKANIEAVQIEDFPFQKMLEFYCKTAHSGTL